MATTHTTSESFFPFARYTSIVGVHTTLLSFTALFLPRTTLLLDLAPSPTATSLDRPQHPFLEALTARPALTLACLCTGAALLQSWWAGWVRSWGAQYAMRGSDDERRLETAALDGARGKALRGAALTTLVASVILHAVLVLFGAPLTTHIPHTYLLALLLALLTLFPPAYALGPPTRTSTTHFTWVRLFAQGSIRNPIERALVYPALGAALGCWAGTIPLALDWDRPWQAYPLPPAYGALAGHILASIAALTATGTFALAEEGMRAAAAEAEAEADARGRQQTRSRTKNGAGNADRSGERGGRGRGKGKGRKEL
ncbi:hypothetical protein H0H81_011517 [Sphagnurus paluster]|uniref:Uncharacterized protein n=1 Tax=Sphagnurus paluster TaxID=117069 RepID=A0A9P7K3X3_9AGAR|nr:hypothetical protein H0H81_011517 [Sphagnurus paluster]